MTDPTQTILSKDAFDKFAADVERPGKVIPKLADLAEKRKGVITRTDSACNTSPML